MPGANGVPSTAAPGRLPSLPPPPVGAQALGALSSPPRVSPRFPHPLLELWQKRSEERIYQDTEVIPGELGNSGHFQADPPLFSHRSRIWVGGVSCGASCSRAELTNKRPTKKMYFFFKKKAASHQISGLVFVVVCLLGQQAVPVGAVGPKAGGQRPQQHPGSWFWGPRGGGCTSSYQQ